MLAWAVEFWQMIDMHAFHVPGRAIAIVGILILATIHLMTVQTGA